MASDLFCQISNREKTAWVIAEDVNHLAFLDINPKRTGHTLVIPKRHSDYLWEMDQQDYLELMMFTKGVADQLLSKSGAERITMEVVGVDVPHTHIHLIPSTFTPPIKKDNYKEVHQALAR